MRYASKHFENDANVSWSIGRRRRRRRREEKRMRTIIFACYRIFKRKSSFVRIEKQVELDFNRFHFLIFISEKQKRKCSKCLFHFQDRDKHWTNFIGQNEFETKREEKRRGKREREKRNASSSLSLSTLDDDERWKCSSTLLEQYQWSKVCSFNDILLKTSLAFSFLHTYVQVQLAKWLVSIDTLSYSHLVTCSTTTTTISH